MTSDELAEWFWLLTKEAHPRMRRPPAPQWGKWRSAAEKLLEEYGLEGIELAANWLFGESENARFWRSNVLTLPQFRNKIDVLEAKRSYEEDSPGRGASRSAAGPVLGAAQRIMARYQAN